jgi:hypothetical protein
MIALELCPGANPYMPGLRPGRGCHSRDLLAGIQGKGGQHPNRSTSLILLNLTIALDLSIFLPILMEETMSADKRHQKPRKEDQVWPYTRVNAYLALAAMATLIAGYASLSVKPWDSFVSLNVAPVLLVIGYCVLVPAAIIYHKRDPKPAGQSAQSQAEGTKA